MLDSQAAEPNAYLVQFGRPGFVGSFRSAQSLERGSTVVIHSARGIEPGEVLIRANQRYTGNHTLDGDVLRIATAEDRSCLAALNARAQRLLANASQQCQVRDLPLSLVDVEVTLDGVAILHALPWDACDATEMLDELSLGSGLTVRLLDLSRGPKAETAPATGCGKPGCGTDSGGSSSCGTGGGCSTGSCSRGSIKSADELTAYFSGLRQQMEETGMVRTPLN